MNTSVHLRREFKLSLLVIFLLLTGSLAQDKKLTIYSSSQSASSIAVQDRSGAEYVDLQDVLGQFGALSVKQSGTQYSVRLAPKSGSVIQAEFTQNSSAVKVGSVRLQLSAPFVVSGGRGLVSLTSLPQLLPSILGLPVNLHQTARRLFVGGISTTFGYDLQKTAPPRLILHFSTPVNPTIASEPGRVRMSFAREPVVASSPSVSLADPVFSSLTYNEANGAAEITVSASLPLLARFSDGGKTVTLSAQQPVPPPVAGTAQNLASATNSANATASTLLPPRFIVVIDPAHGGSDRGAALTLTLAEKDVALAFARRLRTALENQGVTAMLLRDSDISLTSEQRAIAANGARPAMVISVHASSTGSGVHLYTALLPPAARIPFLSWNTAQAAFLDQSEAVATAFSKELNSRSIANSSLAAPLQPLASYARPAIAIELSPIDGRSDSLALLSYQAPIVSAVAAGIGDMRPALEASR